MTWLTRMHLRTWQHQITTIMQPFQCDLQPQIQETHRTTHTGTTTGCRTQRRNRLNSKRSKPHLPHTRGTFHPPADATLHEKIQGFVLRLPPQKKAHATFMQPLQCVLQHGWPACIYAHGNTRWQQSCSHSNAICSHRFKKRIELRTQEQPLVAEHRGGTDWTRNDPNISKPHPPHTRGTFHRRLKPLYTEKYKVSCSGFLPKTNPLQHSCSHYNAFYSMTWLTRMHLRTWQHQMTTIMQPFQCDLQPQIQETHRTTHTGTTTGCRTQRRNRLNSKRSKHIQTAPAAHTRYLSSPAEATLHGKMQGYAAIPMRSAATDSRNA